MIKNSVFKISVDTKAWLKAAGVRAAKTTAQTAVALIPAAVSITKVDWKIVIGSAVLAGVVSILTSVAGIPEVEEYGVRENQSDDLEVDETLDDVDTEEGDTNEL